MSKSDFAEISKQPRKIAGTKKVFATSLVDFANLVLPIHKSIAQADAKLATAAQAAMEVIVSAVPQTNTQSVTARPAPRSRQKGPSFDR